MLAENKGSSFGRQGECAVDRHSFQGQHVAVVDQFLYIGSAVHSSTQNNTGIIRRSGITCAAMQSPDNHFWKSRISTAAKLSCITLVSYQSFYTDLNAERSPYWTHAGLLSRSVMLENSASNLMAPICSQRGAEEDN